MTPYKLVTSDDIAPDYQIQDDQGNVIAVFVCPMASPAIDGKTVLDSAKLYVKIANIVEKNNKKKRNKDG
jgi:hypothetical protein